MVLNPLINENNYKEHLRLTSTTNFIPGFIPLHDAGNWDRVSEAYHWNLKQDGIEANGQLPNYEEALKKIHSLGLELKPLRFNQIYKLPKSLKGWLEPLISRRAYSHIMLIFKYLKSRLQKKTYLLPYPIVGSYSDIFVISADTIKLFCHYCGVFATTKLFVEIGLPTSLILSAKEIVNEKDIKLQGKALWNEELLGPSPYTK